MGNLLNVTVDNINTGGGMMPGVIAAYSGANIPAGWSLCDGNEGRPNLLNRFILGWNPNSSVLGTLGGSKSVTLTQSTMPAHTHSVTILQGCHYADEDHGNHPVTSTDWNGYSTVYGSTSTGNGVAFDIRPQYWTLAYIIKNNEISNTNATTIPQGLIIAYSGSLANIPSGWAICDGNGTPNLVNRFIQGWDPNSSNVGDVGGKNGIALTENNIPPHTHSLTLPRGWGYKDEQNKYMAPTNSESFKLDYGTTSVGSGTSFDNRPPFWSLIYLMKL
jgi:microcystin-dependent protein